MEATIFVRRRSPLTAAPPQPGGCPGRAPTRARTSDVDLSSPQQATGVAILRAISEPAPYLRHEGPLAFAHRGGGHEAPENTLAAFERAVSLGFRYLETDARLTADGVVVAFHDPVLDRLTDRSGRIADLDWTEVAAARVHGIEPVPRLADVLGAWESVRFNIDPKCDEVVEPLARLVRDLGMVERVCFGSFKARRTARLGGILGPEVCRSLGPLGVARLWLRSRGVPVPVRAGPAGCVQVPARIEGRALVDRRFVEAAHRRGLQVHVWTVNDAGHMHRLLDLGVDGLMTDRPSVLRRVLEARGAW
ncbi:MAG: glycerophosphodiester phosphodiesterase [Acidimicrobiia bacterium]|nr:glycerophosphodiester phosphodiesterase [Acidimicrobiia bacterium]MYC46506.1 glycerophosphodiester phosphodiesterase [Acidimicrobiia bacterium]MYI20098.1 glycerophosphodiester phosphodiesterase [Acidimicrobiia bacterium]